MYIYNINKFISTKHITVCFDGPKVSVIASQTKDLGFESWSVQWCIFLAENINRQALCLGGHIKYELRVQP